MVPTSLSKYRPWGCCCFCVPVKEGTVALAFVNLILGFVGAVVTLVILVKREALNAIDKIERLEDCDHECRDKLPFWGAASAFTNVISSVSLFLCALPFVFGVVAFKTRPVLLIPYLAWIIFSAPLELPDFIFTYYTLKSLDISDAFTFTLLLAAGAVSITVRIHFFVVVRQFQKQEMKVEATDQTPSDEEVGPDTDPDTVLPAEGEPPSVLFYEDHPISAKGDPPPYDFIDPRGTPPVE